MSIYQTREAMKRLFPSIAPAIEEDDSDSTDQGRKEAQPVHVPESSYQPYVPSSQAQPDSTPAEDAATSPETQQAIALLAHIGANALKGKTDKNLTPATVIPSSDPGDAGSSYQGSLQPPKPTTPGTNSSGQTEDEADAADGPPVTGAYRDFVLKQIEAEKMKDPRYAAKKRVDDLIARKQELTKDRDHGFLGRLREIADNVTNSISESYKANPNQPWQSLLLGAGGGGVGATFLNHNLNEQRHYNEELGKAEQTYQVAAKNDEQEQQLNSQSRDIARKEYEAETDRNYKKVEAIDKQRKDILDELRQNPNLDVNSKDPDTQDFLARAKAAHVLVTKRDKDGNFQLHIGPNGTPILFDPKSGRYKEGSGDFSKPSTITKADIPYSRFGLLDDSEIDAQAKASVSKSTPARSLTPQAALKLDGFADAQGNNPYKNPDGSINEAKALADGALDTQKDYRNEADNTAQSIAAAKEKLIASQKDRRAAVDRFVSAVSNHKPSVSNPKVISLDDVQSRFKEVLDTKDPKKRASLIDYFIKEYLPKVQIQ